MKNLKEVLPFATKYIGSKYILGVKVPKEMPNYKGAFDCAEFISYCCAQVLDLADYGTRRGDAYTGFYGDDAISKGHIIDVNEAARIPGAILLRLPKPNANGHIVFSQGNGKTIEAHSTKLGVIESIVAGRNWDLGILLPGFDYTENNAAVLLLSPKIVYQLTKSLAPMPYVTLIQQALNKLNFNSLKPDGIFGIATNNAVVDFQRKRGLIVDGEIVPGGETAKALNI